jgi:hypothetical protein
LAKHAAAGLHHPSWKLPNPDISKEAMKRLLDAVRTVYKDDWCSAALGYAVSLLPAVNIKLRSQQAYNTNRPIIVLHGAPATGKSTCGYAIAHANARPKASVINGEFPHAQPHVIIVVLSPASDVFGL